MSNGQFDDIPEYEEDNDLNMTEYHERQMKGAERSIFERPGVDKRGSVLNSEMQFRTDSLTKYAIVKIFTNNSRFFKMIFGVGFGFGILYVFLLLYSGNNENQLLDLMTRLAGSAWGFVVFAFTLAWNVLFVYPITWVFIWGFILARIFYAWILSREHDVFVVIWLDGYKTLRMVMYPRYIDEVGRPYLGGKASILYRILNGGNPRIPFHEDMLAPFMDFLQVSVEHVEDGYGATTLYSGSGVILFTDPSNDIDDNLEAQEVFQYVDMPSETEGYVYRYCALDLDRIVPINIWQSILSGMDLKYWQKYSDERKKNQLLEREINFLRYDKALQYHGELLPTQEQILHNYQGEHILDNDEYRDFDQIGRVMMRHASGN